MKTCLNCEAHLVGRRDKKFCSDSCRNAYNNRQNAITNNLVRLINRKLSKNRRILEEFKLHGKRKISREVMLAKGFDFDLHTSIYSNKKGRTYYYCYEQGYVEVEEGLLVLVPKTVECGVPQ